MEDTQKVSPIEFVHARLDEDEAAAKAAASVAGPDWHHEVFHDLDGATTTMIVSAAGSPLADTFRHDDEEMAPFIARHDPARVLREVAAGRQMLAEYERYDEDPGYLKGLEFAIACRAAVWSDHPDYRPEWKP